MIVLDASAAVELLLDTEAGEAVARRLMGERLHMPAHFDVEVVSTIRRLVLGDAVSERDGQASVEALGRLRGRRWPVRAAMQRAYALRATHSVAGALYITLADALGSPLVTCDGPLSRSHGHGVPIELIA